MRFLILFTICLFINRTANAQTTYLWNVDNIEEITKEPPSRNIRTAILNQADKYLLQDPLSVISREKKFAPDIHYFECIGPYWWPDPNDATGQWINKDGEVNPESQNYDNTVMNEMAKRLQYLSIAYYVSRNNRYYDAAVRQLEVWFINKDSYMLPNLEYGQVIPGRNNNKGRSTGLISMYSIINNTLESIRLLDGTRRLSHRTRKYLGKWFSDFLTWCNTSEIGRECAEGNQNISLAFDVMRYNMAIFTGNKTVRNQIRDSFSSERLYSQVLEDGSQPAELKRTKSMSYSIYNLTHILDYCIIREAEGTHYYEANIDRINNAIMFLAKYIDNESEWPYEQITDWKTCKKELNAQIYRCKRLKGSESLKLEYGSDYNKYSSLNSLIN